MANPGERTLKRHRIDDDSFRGNFARLHHEFLSRPLINSPSVLRRAVMWMSSCRTPESSYFAMTLLRPDQRETCCYSWHGIMPSHSLAMRPALRHRAPGSLSHASNRQKISLPVLPVVEAFPGHGLLLGQRSSMKLFPYYILSDPTSIIQVSGRTERRLQSLTIFRSCRVCRSIEFLFQQPGKYPFSTR